MSQQQPDQNLAHMNAMNMNVAWSNGPMQQHMVGQHHPHHSPEPDMANDAAHLMGMAMPEQIQQHHMYAVQQQMPPQHHQMQPHPQHQIQHHQGPPMHHHRGGIHPQQHLHHAQHQAMMQQPTNMMDVSASSISTAGKVSFNMGDDDTRSEGGNNHEMRNLLNENRHRSLDDIAKELHQNDRGPNSERLRQVFAMLWLDRLCERSRSSVPRGRVYASYASRCANETITVLNPASFGKLVRILYPGLRTRRLGVRGESKYHYVNFALKDDAEQPGNDSNANGVVKPLAPPKPAQNQRETSVSTSATWMTANGTSSSRTTSTTRTTATPPNSHVMRRSDRRDHKVTQRRRNGRIVFEPGQDLRYITDKSIKSTKIDMPYSRNFPLFDHVSADPMTLPDMTPYLPDEIDRDAQSTLVALYRAHCTTIIECVRFCREKSFWHQISSFQGTLTVPVQRLLFHPKMAGWIEHCDTLLYQRLVRLLGFLLLQVLPKPVVECLSNIASNLIPFLRKSFSNFPEHAVNAKVAPASIFSSLVRQALRVNVTAHAAANMLSHSENRDNMYKDMLQAVDVRRIIELLPGVAVDDFVRMCQTKVRRAISPVRIDGEIEKKTVFGLGPYEPTNGETALDLWTNFLHGLPHDFAYASAEDIVTYTQTITSSLTRDITLSQGSSFGTWWVTKCWIDEYVMFLASTGGFLDRYAPMAVVGEESQQGEGAPTIEQAVSQGGSGGGGGGGGGGDGDGGEDVSGSQMSTSLDGGSSSGGDVSAMSTELAVAVAVAVAVAGSGGEGGGGGVFDRAKFPSPLPQELVAEVNGGDDSGIGIRTPEEDYRYEFDQGEQAEMGAPQTQ